MSSQPAPPAALDATFRPDESFARHLDEVDPLRGWRAQFHIPQRGGEEAIYLCGNSLGLQPRSVRPLVEQELRDWERLAVDAHFKGRTPWYSYHESLRDAGERLVGAKPGANEVVMMNSLTVNLHLMLVSFFQPRGRRTKILIEDPCFPSDLYAVKTHLRTRGLDPDAHLLLARPRQGEHVLRTEDVAARLDREGDTIALVLVGGVNFITGQLLDIARITTAAHAHGCIAGWDLAHAAGNVPLQLHDGNVDFAVWCSYKYLNAGPGAVAGCFIHERHVGRTLDDLPRYGGWWGNDPATRFRMHLEPDFVPVAGADAWQISNPPIMAMAPLKASLEIFNEVGMAALRRKSLLLTGYLRRLLGEPSATCDRWEIITPANPDEHGCQLSIFVKDHPRERFNSLDEAGAICDFREPNIIRVAPAPLYNSFMDTWRFARIMRGQP